MRVGTGFPRQVGRVWRAGEGAPEGGDVADKSSGWERTKAGAQAAIVTGQVIARAAGPLAPPPTPPEIERSLTSTTSQVTQRPAGGPGPTLADLTKQAADHQRTREQQQQRRRAAELGYQLRSHEQHEERPLGERERGR